MADQKIYSKGSIALGSGDLLDVTDVKVDVTDGSKLVHVMRGVSGVVQGNEEATITFNARVSEDGEEADWLALVKKNMIKQLRIKLDGRTMTVNGKFQSVGYELPLDDAVTVSLTFIGKVDD